MTRPSYSIYTITNKVTGRVYVGMTSQYPASSRWDNHVNIAKSGSYTTSLIARAMRREGVDEFEFDVVATTKVDNAAILERHWIKV
jgi:GIY-YIG catalytic domain